MANNVYLLKDYRNNNTFVKNSDNWEAAKEIAAANLGYILIPELVRKNPADNIKSGLENMLGFVHDKSILNEIAKIYNQDIEKYKALKLSMDQNDFEQVSSTIATNYLVAGYDLGKALESRDIYPEDKNKIQGTQIWFKRQKGFVVTRTRKENDTYIAEIVLDENKRNIAIRLFTSLYSEGTLYSFNQNATTAINNTILKAFPESEEYINSWNEINNKAKEILSKQPKIRKNPQELDTPTYLRRTAEEIIRRQQQKAKEQQNQ